jgi:hypothetical protein
MITAKLQSNIRMVYKMFRLINLFKARTLISIITLCTFTALYKINSYKNIEKRELRITERLIQFTKDQNIHMAMISEQLQKISSHEIHKYSHAQYTENEILVLIRKHMKQNNVKIINMNIEYAKNDAINKSDQNNKSKKNSTINCDNRHVLQDTRFKIIYLALEIETNCDINIFQAIYEIDKILTLRIYNISLQKNQNNIEGKIRLQIIVSDSAKLEPKSYVSKTND